MSTEKTAEEIKKDSAASIKAWATRRAGAKASAAAAPAASGGGAAAPAMSASAKAWAARAASGKAGGHGPHTIKGKTVHAAIFGDEALKAAGFSHVADSLTGTKRGYSSGRDIRDIKGLHEKLTGAGFTHSTSANGKKQRYTHSGGTVVNVRRSIGRFRAELAAADQRTKKSEDDQFEIDFDRAATLFEERSAAFGFNLQKRGIGNQSSNEFGI